MQGEHGTGRNVAPFVEMEWGSKAYDLMWELKGLFDPDYVLNPGVVLNRVRACSLSLWLLTAFLTPGASSAALFRLEEPGGVRCGSAKHQLVVQHMLPSAACPLLWPAGP